MRRAGILTIKNIKSDMILYVFERDSNGFEFRIKTNKNTDIRLISTCLKTTGIHLFSLLYFNGRQIYLKLKDYLLSEHSDSAVLMEVMSRVRSV